MNSQAVKLISDEAKMINFNHNKLKLNYKISSISILFVNGEDVYFVMKLGIPNPRIYRINGGLGSSVGRAHDSWWGGSGFDSRCGRPLPTGLVGVSIMWLAETEVMVSQLCVMCGSTKNCQTLCIVARPRYNLVVDEDVKKSNKQTNKQTIE